MFNLSTRLPKQNNPNHHPATKQQPAASKSNQATSISSKLNDLARAANIPNPIPFKAKPYQRPKFAKSLTDVIEGHSDSRACSSKTTSSVESNALAAILNVVYNKTREDSEPELMLSNNDNKLDDMKINRITTAKYNSIKYDASKFNKDKEDMENENKPPGTFFHLYI